MARSQYIHEGTAQELAHFLAQQPQNHRFGVIELEVDEEPTSAPDEAKPVIDTKNAAAIAFLDARIAEGIAADPETRRQAEEELEEFKRNMNANRAATGERLIYP